MIAYLLKSAACLALLLLFYHLVLEKEKMHNFNRFYLLIGVIASFLIPLATITTYIEPVVTTIKNRFIQPFSSTTSIDNSAIIIQEDPINYTQIAIYFYAFITLILLLRFGLNLFKIIKKTRIYETVMHQKAKLVLVDDKILPHTFWNYIFINKDDYENKKIEQELFTHELTHVTQKHTLDVLLIEFLQAIFWINPIFLFVKKAIQLNHEFLADETVINQYKNTFQYQHLLLNKAAWKNEYYLASNLNYSLTKKRLTMMTTQSSPTRILLKKLAVIPLLTGFIFLFAQRVEAQEKQEIKEEPIEIIEEDVPFNKEDLSKSEIYKEYYNSKGFFIFKDKNGKQISKKYSDLTEEEKKRLAPPLPLKSKKKVPTQKLIEDLKDSKKYAIWIDGKVAKNDVLNNYKASDFSSHFVSFVYKNARSKRFPQNYQAHLSTHKHFKAENDKRLNNFLKYVKEKHNIKEIEVIKGKSSKKQPINEVEEQKSKKEYIDSPIYKKNSKQSISDIKLKLEDLNKLKLNYLNNNLEAYNTLAKKYNAVPIEKRIIKLKDLNKLESLYKQLSKEEKRNAQPFPECYLPNKKVNQEKPKLHKNWYITIDGQKYYYTFDKNERIARYYKNGKLVNLDIVKEYKKKNKIYEKLKTTGKHYVFKSENAKKEIDREFSDLGGMYFRMPRVDKNKVSRPENRIKPYVELRKGDKIWYKKRSELTEEDKLLLPPPPPRPNATKEEIKRAKKAYHDWKKRVGIELSPPPKKETIKVLIDKKGSLVVDKKPTTINNLKNILDNIKIDKEEIVVIIKTDKGSKYSDFIKVKEILRENKFLKIQYK